MEGLLAELAMVRTRFEVRFNDGELPESAWSERGVDNAEFFVSPNPGEELRPLARIVSGGELSRVMLALKTMANTKPGSMFESDSVAPKTLIFDEVDAGIGGRVADVVGSRLQELGNRFQVFCITHLPQIAARGATQFLIEKSVHSSRTITRVERLDHEGRVDEIARMIGGASITEQTRASARELLDAGSERTRPTKTATPTSTGTATRGAGRSVSDAPTELGERRKAKAKVRG
jgi:DNA repair protein RecN (Recombination protein N)